jgi:4-amino-4-deoxy-L-arabinose transferase-like glycosyltransferase
VRRVDRVVLAIAAAVTLVLLAVANRYGWHRDEFYYLVSGKHLAWGYVDNPPLTPFVARVATELAPHNLFVFRIFPALVAGASVIIGSVVVGELGGDRTARRLGAAVVAAGGFVLGVGHLVATPGFDFLVWLALVAVTCRLLRTQDTRWWVAFGALAGVAMLNKNLVVVLVTGLAAGLVIERKWSLLRSWWLLLGAGIALVIALPTLAWQAQQGWPQFEFAQALAERIGAENRVTLLPLQLLFVGPAFVLVGWRGARWLAGSATYRTLLWTWLAVVVLVFVTGGRPYYAVPLTTVAVLAGITPTLERSSARSFMRLVIPNALIGVLFALPVLPASQAGFAASLNETTAEQIGWPELAQHVANVRDALLSPAERANAIVLTGSYGEAGALDFYRKQFSLPPAYSPHNSYADFGQPTNDDATVIAVRFGAKRLAEFFTDCREAGRVRNDREVANEVFDTPIYVCRGLRQPWAQTWDKMRFFS